MFTLNSLFAALLGYIFGSIPFALVIGKIFYKTDIRQFGSGNLGGTNAGRVLGKKAGLSVSILDIFKAFIVMLIVKNFDPSQVALAGVFATLGHIYPIFAGFKGGKAVSTAAGYILGVSTLVFFKPVEMALIPLLSFFLVLKLTKYVSLSSMTALSLAALISFFVQNDLMISFYLSLLVSIVIYRHKANIDRLIKGTESKVKWI
jgi:acyl phosphate:glycerol-3-phosphate acyltransferase